MQEVFENIINNLEKRAKECDFEGNRFAERKYWEDYCAEKNKMQGLNEAIEIVKQEAEKFGTDINVGSNGWIPVSDHIPVPVKKSFGNKQKRTDVLVTLRNGLVKEMTFEFETNEFFEVGDDNHIEHWKEDAIDTDTEVIAWQPLPEPYQPKGE